MKDMHAVITVAIVFFIGVESITGLKSPDSHWKLDRANADRWTSERNDSAQGVNKGQLLQNTKILDVDEWRAAKFDGNYSGIVISNVTNNCILTPETCRAGFSVSFHIKWPRRLNETRHGYVIASENFSVYSAIDGQLYTSLWNGTHEWLAVYRRNMTIYGWTCFVISWDHFSLTLFSNLSQAASVLSNMTRFHLSRFSETRSNYSLAHGAKRRKILIGNSAGEKGLRMYFDDLKIWNSALRENETRMACRRGAFGGRDKMQQYEYPSQIYSSIKFANKALHGHVFKRKNVTSLSVCIEECKKVQKNCQSFNIGRLESDFVCELSNDREKSHHLNLIDKEGYFYYDVYWGKD